VLPSPKPHSPPTKHPDMRLNRPSP